MKKNIFKICKLSIFIIALFLVTSCSLQTTRAVNMVDIKKTDFSKIEKKGEACGTYIFGFIGPFGDPSLVQAARDGNITTIDAVDEKSSYYILFGQRCKIVYGH